MSKNQLTSHSRYGRARGFLLFWCFFIGLGAVAGSIGMLSDPSGKAIGMDPLLPYFQILPFADILFQDFVFSGFSLLIVNGLTNLTAAVLLIASIKIEKKLQAENTTQTENIQQVKKVLSGTKVVVSCAKSAVVPKTRIASAGIFCGGLFGVTLMLWICIQFYMFEPNYMDTLYFIFGLLQFLTGYACFVFYRQETFVFNTNDYPNVGSGKERTLVVFFSRLGRTKQLAYQRADELGADILELESTEMTEGTLGFWWCGRFGMHAWEMPLKPYNVDVGSYDKVVICTPIWVFGLASPIRRFLAENRGRITNAEYIIVHFNPVKCRFAADDMDRILGIKRISVLDVTSELGKTRRISRY